MALNLDIQASLLNDDALRQIFTKAAAGSDAKRERSERAALSIPSLQMGTSVDLKACTAQTHRRVDLAPDNVGRPNERRDSTHHSSQFRVSNSFMTAATRKKLSTLKQKREVKSPNLFYFVSPMNTAYQPKLCSPPKQGGEPSTLLGQERRVTNQTDRGPKQPKQAAKPAKSFRDGTAANTATSGR